MKRWIRWAAWLYPAEWRLQYGAEFDVFLNDAPLRWRDLADVVRGAAIMQMMSWTNYWKTALLAATAGAILAGAWSFTIPNQYVCTSSLALSRPGAAPGQLQRALTLANMAVLGHDNRIALVKDGFLGLYEKERKTLSVEDVADNVLRKHLYVIPFSSNPSEQAFRIVFSYPDPLKAQAVVERLTTEFQTRIANNPDAPTLSVLEPPVLPQKPTSPVRPAFAAIGAITGVLLAFVAYMIRRNRGYAMVTFSLPRETKRLLDAQVAAGPYRSVDEYMNQLIRTSRQPPG